MGKVLRVDLAGLADVDRQEYAEARPWPHIVMDDVIDPAIVAAAESEQRGPALNLPVSRTTRQIKAESSKVNGPATRSILDALGGGEFVNFLENLTGVQGLITDPTHYLSGLHVLPCGGFQALHRDFRVQPVSRLYHRVNVITYLNSDWKIEYGGHLELWASDKSTCERRIAPLAGKTVIFEATPTAFHGVPDPVGCPAGRVRLSLAAYYYTPLPGPDDERQSTFRRPKRPQDPWYIGFRDVRKLAELVRSRLTKEQARVMHRQPGSSLETRS
jgi:hypothetical protein